MVRIIGDVHGKIDNYLKLLDGVDYSIQVGDMGFDYKKLYSLNSQHHRFFGGNHENYDIYYNCPYIVGNGDFGSFNVDNIDMFFIRGEYSIDKHVRLLYEAQGLGKGWWAQEELNTLKMKNALKEYQKEKPKVMLSHGCPNEISKLIGNPGVLKAYGYNPDKFSTLTQTLLQDCFDSHQPDIWIFGHFHMNLDFPYKNTRFICLSELSYLDIYSDGRIINNNKLRKVIS
jgi:predicted phosphodiesterase